LFRLGGRRTTTELHDLGSNSGLTGKASYSECSEEPIRVPGTIQPHGGFLAVDPLRGFTVVAASRNVAALLAGASPTGGMLGRGLDGILGTAFTEAVRQRLQDGRLRGDAPWQSTLRLADGSVALDVAVHAEAGLVQVELERAGEQDGTVALESVRRLEEAIVELRGTPSELEALARVTTRGIRALTGYERVLVYRFDGDWNGQAIAEDKVADWEQSLDGLHFPAADIPAQARELYRRSPIRWVPDRDAVPVALDVAPDETAFGRPGDGALPRVIDLSFARLRSLSPVHMQYHRNMGVDGSMSLSILHEGRLWGLVVCHHRRPHHPSPGQRAGAVALTEAFAPRVGLAERTGKEQARRGDLVKLAALLAHMAGAEVVTAALTTGEVTISSLFASTGAAVLYEGEVSLLGQTPPEAELRDLAAWLRMQPADAKLFQTDSLAAEYPPWEKHIAIASGVLAVFLSADRSDMLLWFRPEEPQLVSWGGSPHKGAGRDSSLLPRLSFARWVEMRHGQARPWTEWELEIAESLRHGITEVIVRGLRRIADLNDRLRQSQKMEAVGQLTGGIAHDFNNLLTGIVGSLGLLQTRVAQGRLGGLDRYIGAATSSANRAASLTHRLLAFSRRQPLDPKVVDVNRLTASMEELIRRTAGPAIHVETVMAGGLWKTLCDANQLENALLNLAINACDAMPDGGRLTIEAANVRLDDLYARRHYDVAPGHYVAMSVTDTGTGMTPEVVARVFEPFFTTKPLGEGTGLGLSMVYGFAKQSNGYASIYSEVGRGTTVRLYLPRTSGEEEEVALPEAAPDIAAKTSGTVLLVDDEPVVRMLIGEILQDQDYEVIEAGNGAEALRVLQSGRRVDLLVSDVGLPGGMNGRQLADAARVHQPKLKVLFITGYAESAIVGNGVLEAHMQMLTKPFAMDVLAAKVKAML